MEKYRAKISEEDKALIDDSFALADRIHFLLEKHGISQRELAKRLNKQESQVSKWLDGGHNFTQATLTKLDKQSARKYLSFQNRVIILIYLDENFLSNISKNQSTPRSSNTSYS